MKHIRYDYYFLSREAFIYTHIRIRTHTHTQRTNGFQCEYKFIQNKNQKTECIYYDLFALLLLLCRQIVAFKC